MADYKTPGVYVEEISTLPPSAGQVPTAIPAFVGYTQKALKSGKDLTGIPVFISSLLDYKALFGEGYNPQKIEVELDKTSSIKNITFDRKFFMYDSMRMFFANGGGQCFVVSVGNYTQDIEFDKLSAGVDAVLKEDLPTILVSPDAVLLPKKDQCYALQQQMLMQCFKLQDRVALFDIYDGYIDRADEDVVMNFRNGIGVNHLKYGAAYYPWIQTTFAANFSYKNIVLKDADGKPIKLETLVEDPTVINNLNDVITDLKEIEKFIVNPFGDNISFSEKFLKIPDDIKGTKEEVVYAAGVLKDLIVNFLKLRNGLKITNASVRNEFSSKTSTSSVFANVVRSLFSLELAVDLGIMENSTEFAEYDLKAVKQAVGYEGLEETSVVAKARILLKTLFESLVEVLSALKKDAVSIERFYDKMVFDTNVLYQSVVNEVSKESSKLPPSGAIAGVYANVDASRGVWKAPANVSLSSCVRPWVKINNDQQEDLNVDLTGGKSVNVVRAFVGQGNLVWGARTLAGNDNEWRYISVRRFFNMVEKSLKLSTNWAVFEPNDEVTWIKVKAMISNFLTNLWRAGALVGGSAGDAFFVNIGLGTTMTQVDVLEGRMNVEIGMAVVRPAEFIVLKFSHKFDLS